MKRKCPFCAEEIHPQANRCKFCKSDLQTGSPSTRPPAVAGPVPGPGPALNDLPVGKERSVMLVLLLGFITCGIYAIVHVFLIAGEINRHSRMDKLSPGMDIFLTIITCGFWGFVMCYKYPRAVYEMQVEEGIPATNQAGTCLILAFLGLSIVAPLMVQSELNKHWLLHNGRSM